MPSSEDVPPRLRVALVVEDHGKSRAAFARILSSRGLLVLQASNVREADEQLESSPRPDLILIDVRLPDGPIDRLLETACRMVPAPVVVAMSGVATPEESFRLNHLGVREYLAKPFGTNELLRAIRNACAQAPPLEPIVAARVGRVGLRELQRQVREVMVREALAQSEGSCSGAARLLHVTRQAVQQFMRTRRKSATAPGGEDPSGRPRIEHASDHDAELVRLEGLP